MIPGSACWQLIHSAWVGPQSECGTSFPGARTSVWVSRGPVHPSPAALPTLYWTDLLTLLFLLPPPPPRPPALECASPRAGMPAALDTWHTVQYLGCSEHPPSACGRKAGGHTGCQASCLKKSFYFWKSLMIEERSQQQRKKGRWGGDGLKVHADAILHNISNKATATLKAMVLVSMMFPFHRRR